MTDLLQELLDELDMKDSSYRNMQAPHLADGLVTTSNDYEKFMQAFFNSRIVSMVLSAASTSCMLHGIEY